MCRLYVKGDDETTGFLEIILVMRKAQVIIWTFAVTLVMSCRQVYLPPASSVNGSYLVVEGVVNPGPDSTIIKLSHTVKLDSGTTATAELNAQVTVESDQNASYSLYEAGGGSYISPNLHLPNGPKYRMRIKTAAGKEYLSDFVEVKNAPPIDSVNFKIGANVLNLFVNAHDVTNKTRYYRWSYNETYEYHSTFFSGWKSNGDTVLIRDQVNDEIYTCWRGGVSSSIILGSSVKLANDVIAQSPLTYFPSTSEKIFIDYSMLLKQYALTPDAFAFWDNLKKNTEQLGSIFDAQPSQIKGNIHCVTNPAEPVVGYLSAGAYSSKRIFITKDQLPYRWQLPDNTCLEIPYFFVVTDQFGRKTYPEDINFNYNKGAIKGAVIPTSAIIFGTTVIGHKGSDPQCVDCTLRGTNVKPSYWNE
jgi:hypothetical protein